MNTPEVVPFEKRKIYIFFGDIVIAWLIRTNEKGAFFTCI